MACSRLAAVGVSDLFGIDQQVAIGPMLVAAHAAAQLVQVGQAVAVGLVDEDRVGVGNVEPALDDRRGQQQVELVVDEVEHHLFQLPFGHLAVADADAGLGHDLPQPPGEVFDVVDAVVDEEDLPAAVQFAQRRRGGSSSASKRATRVSMASRSAGGVSRFEMSRRPNSDMCSVRGNGRGGHRQHVDRRAAAPSAAPSPRRRTAALRR